MKSLFISALVIALPVLLTAQNVPQKPARYEASGYFNLSSVGKNVSSQADLGFGLGVYRWLHLEATTNVGYRNYSLITNDYLALTFGTTIKDHEFRLGPLAGYYTLWLSRYHASTLGIGGEAIYSYSILPAVSIRMKERIFQMMDSRRSILATSTMIGFCYGFGGEPLFGTMDAGRRWIKK